MCRFQTSWNIDHLDKEDMRHCMNQLRELKKDGLVEIGVNHIKVTEKGKPFIRNISMAFDLKLHRKQPETRLFSMTV